MNGTWLRRLTTPECASCHTKATVILCQQCINRIERASIACLQCAKPMESETQHQRCADCLRESPSFDTTRYIGLYANDLKALILSAKLKRDVSAIQALRYLCQRQLDLSGLAHTCLVAVPSPKIRMASRGFNLPQLLAITLHRHYGLPIVKHAFHAPVYVRKQTRQSRQARLKKSTVFTATNALKKQLSITPHVLLVDDVLTTGKTAASIASHLKSCGAETVSIAVLAR